MVTCSYCHSRGHNISICNKAAFTRAFELYNEGTDSFASRRVVPADWVKDRNVNNPSHENWNVEHIRPRVNDHNPAERAVVYYISRFRAIRPDISSDGHDNMDHYVTKLNTSPGSIVRVVLNNENKVGCQFFRADCEQGTALLANFTRQHKHLMQLRATHRTTIWHRERAQRHAQQQQRRDLLHRQRAQQQQQQQQELLVVMRDEPVEATDCPICMEPLANTNKTILRCGHQFCGDCIFQHFQGARGTNCPHCRAVYAIRVRGWHPPAAQPPNHARHNYY